MTTPGRPTAAEVSTVREQLTLLALDDDIVKSRTTPDGTSNRLGTSKTSPLS